MAESADKINGNIESSMYAGITLKDLIESVGLFDSSILDDSG